MMTAISAWWTFSNTKKKKNRKKIVYPSIPSSIAPVNHGPELPIPQPPTTHAISSTSSEDDDAEFEFDTQCTSKDPHFPNQNELDDLTRDVEAEAGSGSGGSGLFLWKRKREKFHRFRFHRKRPLLPLPLPASASTSLVRSSNSF